ncbi:MAG: DUF1365 domain-containing protein [Pseudomonadota bacterium]
MTASETMRPWALYSGEVVHARVKPQPHKLRYRVFSLLVDVDRLDELSRTVQLFSYNRTNVISLFDTDYGDRTPVPLGDRARQLLSDAGLTDSAFRIRLLTYPRVFGAVFNPLSVYFCYRANNQIGAIIYEVSNTFGERKSYVLEAGAAENGVIAQTCSKEMSVSPFTRGTGQYAFRLIEPQTSVSVGVALRDDSGPILKAHFYGTYKCLTSPEVIRQFRRTPFLAQRVLGGIHAEAFKLWWKGVPVFRRHRSPKFSVSVPHAAPDR